jgi:hypothetical protein
VTAEPDYPHLLSEAEALIRRARNRLAEVIDDARGTDRLPMINARQIDLLLDPDWDPNAHQCGPTRGQL